MNNKWLSNKKLIILQVKYIIIFIFFRKCYAFICFKRFNVLFATYLIEEQDKLRVYIKKYMFYYATEHRMFMDYIVVKRWKEVISEL